MVGTSNTGRFFSFTLFDERYKEYDEWYRKNPDIALNELECVKSLLSGLLDPSISRSASKDVWGIEVGVGNGVFAQYLSIPVGIDPAVSPLNLSLQRGLPHAIRSVGEHLPFRRGVFAVAIIVVTLCFADDPLKLLKTTHEVLREGGVAVVCVVPRNSFLGISYMRKRALKSSFYRHARFFSLREVFDMLLKSGFAPLYKCSTLEWGKRSLTRLSSTHQIEYPLYTDTLVKHGFHCILSKKVG